MYFKHIIFDQFKKIPKKNFDLMRINGNRCLMDTGPVPVEFTGLHFLTNEKYHVTSMFARKQKCWGFVPICILLFLNNLNPMIMSKFRGNSTNML